MSQKYKVGDHLKVVGETHGHGFELGSVVEVVSCNPLVNGGTGDYFCKGVNTTGAWYLTDEEVVLVGVMKIEQGQPYNHDGETPQEFAGVDLEVIGAKWQQVKEQVPFGKDGDGMRFSEIMERFEKEFTIRELAYIVTQDALAQSVDPFQVLLDRLGEN